MRRSPNIAIISSAALIIGLAVGSAVAERAIINPQTVTCVDGKVPAEGDGYIAAIDQISQERNLHLGAAVFDLAHDLTEQNREPAHRGQWIRLELDERGNAVSASLGPCPVPSAPISQ